MHEPTGYDGLDPEQETERKRYESFEPEAVHSRQGLKVSTTEDSQASGFQYFFLLISVHLPDGTVTQET